MRGSTGRLVVGLAAVLACAGVPAGLAADPLPAQAPRIADYDIAVRLDTDAKRLAGTLRLTWRNPSSDSVPDLWFHLYLNAFRDRDSTFWRESRGQLRDVPMPDNGWGRIEVTALRIAGGADLLPSLTFEAPDDGNRRDRTLARIRLPQPVAPGGLDHEQVVDVGRAEGGLLEAEIADPGQQPDAP